MDAKILTHEGFAIDIGNAPDPKDFVEQLNNRALFTLALADMVLAKNLFKMVVPSGELTGGYEVHTSDGLVHLTDIEDYDTKKIAAAFNDSRLDFILVGDLIIQRHNFKLIRKVAE